MENPTNDRNPVEVLGEEFLQRRRSGENATVDEYATAYPELADEVRRLFRTMIAMERFKDCALSSGTSVELEIEGLEQLGDFRILREIGRGGMGVVYEAEQQSLRRRVAVKVFPRRSLPDSRQLDRFRREAQTAARLHHTNIVPVFGVGQQDGLHYFVMQRIDGIALDEYLNGSPRPTSDAHAVLAETEKSLCANGSTIRSGIRIDSMPTTPLSDSNGTGDSDEPHPGRPASNPLAGRTSLDRSYIRWVANIGIQVAEAVAYAHGQGVLHRDIKPSNLLLDPQGAIWVTDFGLATAMNPVQQTTAGEVAGTLRYMAPEHLAGLQDARGDIYSLGLTLYELLTMQPAFPEKSRAKVLQQIASGEYTPLRSIRPEVPRDLEAIVSKATAHEPERRYESMGEMASELRRFAEGRPVRARYAGPWERGWRWATRNPAVASLSAALLLLAISSFALVSTKWREAVAENQRAEGNLSLALESMDQILERFASGWMAHPLAPGDGGDTTASDVEFQIAVSDHSVGVLQDALRFYDQFAAQNATNSELQRATANVHRRVADIYDRLGQYANAELAYRRSLSILDAERIDTGGTLAIDRASTLNQLGLTMYATSRLDEAETEFRRAMDVLSDDRIHDEPKRQAELARIHSNLGQTLWLLRRHDEAKQSHQQAVRILESLVQQHPTDTAYRLALAHAYRTFYPFVAFGNRNAGHETIRSSGIEILEKLVRDYPKVPDYQCELSEMLTATSFGRRDATERSEQAIRLQRAVALEKELTRAHPSIPRYRAVLAHTLKVLGNVQGRSDREDADHSYAEAVSIYRSLAQEFSEIPVYHLFLAMTLADDGRNLREMGRVADSRAALLEGIAEQKTYIRLRPNSHFGKGMLARLYRELAATLTILDAADEADQARREAERLHCDQPSA